MKARKRILDIRRQSRISSSNENLWFFSDDRTDDQSAEKRKSVRNDRLSIFKDDYNRYSLEDSDKDSKKKECPFIVDWQMSDTF